MARDRRIGMFVVMAGVGFVIGLLASDRSYLSSMERGIKNLKYADLPESVRSRNVDPAILLDVTRNAAYAFYQQTRQKGLRVRIRENPTTHLVCGVVGLGIGCAIAAFCAQGNSPISSESS